jgi:hypothetical protein
MTHLRAHSKRNFKFNPQEKKRKKKKKKKKKRKGKKKKKIENIEIHQNNNLEFLTFQIAAFDFNRAVLEAQLLTHL